MTGGGDYTTESGDARGVAFAVATGFERRAVDRALARHRRRGVDVPTVVNCGIGVRDRASLNDIADYRCLVSTGFAAALDPRLGHGSLFMPTEIAGPDDATWHVDSRLHARLSDALAAASPIQSIHTGKLIHSEAVVRTPGEKKALFESSGACGTDMESARLARVCAAHGLPYAVLRVVLDPADATMPDAVVTGEAEAPGAWTLLGRLAQRPRDLWPMLVLLRYVAASRQTLVTAIDRSLPVLQG